MVARLLKGLHELGAIGVMGALGACLVLLVSAPQDSLEGYAAIRRGMDAIARWMLVPSLAIVLISGLLSIAANRAYVDAGWAWIKALLGIAMFEGTLLNIQATGRKVMELSQAALASGQSDAAALAPLLRTEWLGLWTMFALSFVNLVLAVWRPRLQRRRSQEEPAATVSATQDPSEPRG
jgi:hypothetical protein